MKRKTRVLFIIVVMLGIVVFAVFNHKEQEPARMSERDFAVKDIDAVTRIFMADRAGHKIDLKKQKGYWTVNDKFKAMQPKVDMLLETINKVQVKYPVSKAEWDNVIPQLSSVSTKVEIYKNEEKNPSKVYHVGGNTKDSKGTYMIMMVDGKIAKHPYVTYIPGFEGMLSVRYFLDETEWRDTGIFDYKMEEIQKITLEYPKEEKNSFEITRVSEDSFAVQPLTGVAIQSEKPYKQGLLKYLTSFDFLNAEAYDNENPKKDSIINTTPYAILTVEDRSGQSRKMTVYHMPINRRSKLQYDQYGNKVPFDLDRYYALINDGKDFVIIQDFVFGKVFKTYEDFFTKET